MNPGNKYEFSLGDFIISKKMFTITNKQIDSKFLAICIQVRGLLPNLKIHTQRNQNHIGCPHILNHITEIYKHFLNQNCSLEQYFGREIIIAKKQRHSDDCYIEEKIISGVPIIIVVDRKVLFYKNIIFESF